MADVRPVLVALSGVGNTAPEQVLYPYPAGSVGSRLWQMIRLASPGFTDVEYLRHFDRVNLCPAGPPPSGTQARRQLWANLANQFRGRNVVVLGRAIFALTSAPDSGPCILHPMGLVAVGWIPHPGGSNRFYNSGQNRLHVGEFLLGLVRRG